MIRERSSLMNLNNRKPPIHSTSSSGRSNGDEATNVENGSNSNDSNSRDLYKVVQMQQMTINKLTQEVIYI